MGDPRILVTMMTHFTEHEAEDKRARRSVARTKECIECDPECRNHVALGTRSKRTKRDHSHHADTTLDVRDLHLVLYFIVTALRMLLGCFHVQHRCNQVNYPTPIAEQKYRTYHRCW
jgi:hypothetical protein